MIQVPVLFSYVARVPAAKASLTEITVSGQAAFY